jgi:phospholipase C
MIGGSRFWTIGSTPFFELGVRVPLAVISPYAKPHFVSHVVQEHTAITRFIEVLFGLPALTARDANSDALLDMLDFSAPPCRRRRSRRQRGRAAARRPEV